MVAGTGVLVTLSCTMSSGELAAEYDKLFCCSFNLSSWTFGASVAAVCSSPSSEDG